MIEFLKTLLSDENVAEPENNDSQRLAAAALLVEVSRSDFEQNESEEKAMATLLTSSLGIDQDKVQLLIEHAGDAVDSATSLYEFTREINDHYSYEEKCELIESMWLVAYADSRIDKYEEHLIRRVTDLLYVSHEDFIKGKHRAKEKVGS